MSVEAKFEFDHIHDSKEKEKETIVIYNTSWRFAFARDCSVRGSYLCVGSAVLPPTRVIPTGGVAIARCRPD